MRRGTKQQSRHSFDEDTANIIESLVMRILDESQYHVDLALILSRIRELAIIEAFSKYNGSQVKMARALGMTTRNIRYILTKGSVKVARRERP